MLDVAVGYKETWIADIAGDILVLWKMEEEMFPFAVSKTKRKKYNQNWLYIPIIHKIIAR